MPNQLKQYAQQLTNSLQQAISLHHHQLQKLVESGKLKQEEALQLAQEYAAALEAEGAPVEWAGAKTLVEAEWLQNWQRYVQDASWRLGLYEQQKGGDE
ncbi:hypothetical protein, partial [Phaeodactylibacter luteus]